MLALQQAQEIKASIVAYLRATFMFRDKQLVKAFDDFILDKNNGMFKGPYISLKLPFVQASQEEQEQIPLTIHPNWPPYKHQIESWQRLSTQNDQEPQPTLVTTGTGSGKTESFLYPLLDYCYHNRSRRGIKAIILYPMNALATDQAKRLAEIINEDPHTRGEITAGLFIGEGKRAANKSATMGADHIIESREAIVAAPPDILLTNFKMLDYALMRAQYHNLWQGNLEHNDLLKFLVLDELHTYDGAQGTDVANLIRRLKLKLNVPEHSLCPVGTSATLGTGESAAANLANYAARVFGESIDQSAIVEESRLSVEKFWGKGEMDDFLPRPQRLGDLDFQEGEAYNSYIDRLCNTWQVNRNNLVKDLKGLLIVKELLQVMDSATESHLKEEDIISRIAAKDTRFAALREDGNVQAQEAVVSSLLSLISEAQDTSSGKEMPMLFTQVQFWIRELSGVVREVSENARFVWLGEQAPDSPAALPPYYCRECGASGWLGQKHDNKERFERDVKDTNKKFVERSKHIYFVNKAEYKAIDSYQPTESRAELVDLNTLEFVGQPNENSLATVFYRKRDGNYTEMICPYCESRNTIAIIGTRMPTLSSIAVGQSLATDLNAQTEKERKVLAFTNSVQDAAHQAAFIEARNYRFTFRGALQRVINLQDGPITLSDLSQQFITHWKTNANENVANDMSAYFQRFIPADLKGKYTAEWIEKDTSGLLQQDFDRRIEFEVFSEFGFNSLIGRTLEKTGASSVRFDAEKLHQTWDIMCDWLSDNNQASVDENAFKQFAIVVLHRMRQKGAIGHIFYDKFRTNDAKRWNLNWNNDGRHRLNRYFGGRSRLPKVFTGQPIKNDLIDSSYGQTDNWFHAYLRKSFPIISTDKRVVNDFFSAIFDAFLTADICEAKALKEIKNYALQPEAIWVGSHTQQYTCTTCGEKLSVSANEMLLGGASCSNYRCTGRFEEEPEESVPNYYQKVYNRLRTPRVFASEHTGLLERDKREQVEVSFKERPRTDSLNALVATSTLEMGIDIGNLNSTFNNAVPPLPANFLQRVGRAGRKSGTALIVNFAKRDAHDQYYFAAPEEMMQGQVHTPGCYLEAYAILRRHFWAFCIDSWATANPTENHIPSKLAVLKLLTTDLTSADFLVNRILNFLKANESHLVNYFQQQYKEQLNEGIFAELQEDLYSERFYEFQRAIFNNLKTELQKLVDLQKEIQQRIKKEKLGKKDEKRQILEKEKKNLGGIIRSIQKRQVLEHLTNVGALPNYAFPETGVQFNATVALDKQNSKQKTEPFELVRPGSQAIRELAPDNTFYTQGYRFAISGINTFDWTDKSVRQEWKFCSNCDHVERIEKVKESACPKCGHASWNASVNEHLFVKMTGVKSYELQNNATIRDNSDDRDSEFYTVSRHWKFDQRSSSGAWTMKNIPFGIEYIKNSELVEINLGHVAQGDADRCEINGHSVPAKGFVTCKNCGRSTAQRIGERIELHYPYCKSIAVTNPAHEVFEQVYLFRELKTEAIKILLPVQEFEDEAEIEMFRAGMELGLRKYYNGNPQHIRLIPYREHNHITGRFDRYLVMYDTIPGGAGYLQKLFDYEVFNQVLLTAYLSIKECECQHYGKDGCYRCIYTYNNQYIRPTLSRAAAEISFKRIVGQQAGWEHQTIGLNQITNNGKIEESELEHRFVRSLKKYCENNNGSFSEYLANGEVNYCLSLSTSKQTVHYDLIPQYSLGPQNGVRKETKPDFLLRCIGADKQAKAGGDLPKIAVYLDGYHYHASEEHQRFLSDIEKRRAIAESNAFVFWVLTWNDLESFDLQFSKSDEEKTPKVGRFFEHVNDPKFSQTKKTLKTSKLPFNRASDNMALLLEMLMLWPIQNRLRLALVKYLGQFQEKLFVYSYPPTQEVDILNLVQEPLPVSYVLQNKNQDAWVLSELPAGDPLFSLRVFVNLQQQRIICSSTILPFDEIDEETWRMYWHIANVLQFGTQYAQDKTTGQTEQEFDESILDLFEDMFHDYIRQLWADGRLSDTEDSIAQLNILFNENGSALAEADFVAHKEKKAFNPLSDADAKAFEKAGYSVEYLEER